MKVPFIKYVEALIMCKYPPDKIMEDIHNLKVPLSDVFTFENLQQVYNSLKHKKEYLEDEISRLQKENAYLQKEYFELKNLEPEE